MKTTKAIAILMLGLSLAACSDNGDKRVTGTSLTVAMGIWPGW